MYVNGINAWLQGTGLLVRIAVPHRGTAFDRSFEAKVGWGTGMEGGRWCGSAAAMLIGVVLVTRTTAGLLVFVYGTPDAELFFFSSVVARGNCLSG